MDDTTLYYAAGTAQEVASVLKDDLGGLAHLVRNTGLKLNENKTQVMMLSRKGRVKELENIKVTLSEVEILRHIGVLDALELLLMKDLH